MARAGKDGRVIYRDISTSETIADLGDPTSALFATLCIPHADDQGRMVASPRKLKGQVCPLLDFISIDDVEHALERMATVGLIALYSAPDGTPLLQFTGWWRWNCDQPYIKASEFPPPPGWVDCPPGKRTGREDSYGFSELPGNSENGQEKAGNGLTASLSLTPSPIQSLTPGEGEGESEGKGEGEKPPPPAPPPRKRGKRRPDHPAVKAFYDAGGKGLARGWREEVPSRIGDDPEDLDFWSQVVHTWVGLGYNPTNVVGMLECYERRQLPEGQRRPAREGFDEATVKAILGRCQARYPGETFALCELKKGHDGPHEGGAWNDRVTWEDSDGRKSTARAPRKDAGRTAADGGPHRGGDP